jgi:hypothetical protein
MACASTLPLESALGDPTLLALLQRDEPSGLQTLIQLAVLAFFFLGPLLNRKKDGDKRGKSESKPRRRPKSSDAEERGGDLWRQLLDLDAEPEGPTTPASSDPNAPELPRPVAEAGSRSRRGPELPPSPPKRTKASKPSRSQSPGPHRPLGPTPSESELESGSGREDAWAEAGLGLEDQVESGGSPEEWLERGGSSEEALERGGVIERVAFAEITAFSSSSLSEPSLGAELEDSIPDSRERDRRASWRAAVVAAEVLGRPVALRDSDAEGPLGLQSH